MGVVKLLHAIIYNYLSRSAAMDYKSLTIMAVSRSYSGMCTLQDYGWYKEKGLKLLNGWFVLQLAHLLKLSVPIALTTLFQVSLLWISLLFLGHLPHVEDQDSYLYPAAALPVTLRNCAQSMEKVGVILQRGILILGLVMFPIWAVWLNTESLLLILQQPPCVAKFSAFFTNVFTLALPFIFLYVLLQRYLQSQSIVWQFVLIGFISNILNVILHAVTIYGIGLKFKGAVVSLVISNILPPLMVIGYVWCRKLHKETWGGWSFESLEEWWLFLKLAVPGMFMTALEWWSFEIINFLAGALGEVELSTNIVWFLLLVVLFMPALGLNVATSIRVGNELGAGNPEGAKRVTCTAITIVFIFSTISSVFLISTRHVISQLFVPRDEEVAREVSRLLCIGAIFVFCDQFQTVIGGALRGSGRQHIGAIVNFIAYYVIGLPLGVVIGFKTSLGLFGIWIGMTVGNTTQCIIFVIVLILTNWQKQSDKAIRRAQDSESDKEKVEDTEARYKEKPEASTDRSSNEEETENLLEPNGVAKEENEKTLSKTLVYKIRKLLIHGSFFVVGVGVLIAGGVASQYHPHVDPEEYYNCTTLIT